MIKRMSYRERLTKQLDRLIALPPIDRGKYAQERDYKRAVTLRENKRKLLTKRIKEENEAA